MHMKATPGMFAHQLVCGLALAGTLAGALRGQDDRSTLLALLEGASTVAVARAVTVDDRDSAHLRVTFAVEERLHGPDVGPIVLSEPRGRGCGRAFTAVVAGQRFVLCVREDDGALALSAGGARALPRASAAVVQHVRALLAAAPGAGRLAVLLAALSAGDERVRTDAALALSSLPALEQADASQRAVIAAALAAALAEDARTMPSLLLAAARLRLREAIAAVLPRYLAGQHGAAEHLLRDSMLRIGGETVAREIAARLPDLREPLARARATTLLLEIDDDGARAPLLELLRTADERGTKLRACAGLLRLGVDGAALQPHADAELLELAQRAAAPSRPRFRSIRTQ
jgi:hypothetical protein